MPAMQVSDGVVRDDSSHRIEPAFIHTHASIRQDVSDYLAKGGKIGVCRGDKAHYEKTEDDSPLNAQV